MRKILPQKNFKKISSSLLFTAIFAAAIFANINSYAATDYGVGRIRTCTKGSVEGLDFDPGSGGKDVEFVLSNPVCAGVIAKSYITTKGLITTMNNVCKTGSRWPRIAPSPIMDAKDIAYATKKAAQTRNGACGTAVGLAAASLASSMADLGIIYGIAQSVYGNTEICGANWRAPNPSAYDFSAGGYKATLQNEIDKFLQGQSSDVKSLDISDPKYREWYYGGVEVEDAPADGSPTCLDPIKGGNQKYYLKGTETGNYNCKQFDIRDEAKLPSGVTLEDMRNAYDCCIKRSKNYICINYAGTKKFCRAGENCTIDAITFSTRSLDDGRIICAETYSLCPYNFTIGGGTEHCNYFRDGIWDDGDQRWRMITPENVEKGECASNSVIRNQNCTYNDKAGKCENYCQYMRHCTRTADVEFRYESGLSSPYFSTACVNFEGDSQNKTAFNGGFLIGSQRHFSAPIAQCVKETLENVFYNRVGHTKCLDYHETPLADGTCASGQYSTTEGNFKYQKGNQAKEKSFFTIVQNTLQSSVKIVLTLSVMFYGMNLLLKGGNFGGKKELMTYVLKISLVLYFATGDAWQTTFFKGVYGASSALSSLVFKLETDKSDLKRDGCQFGKVIVGEDRVSFGSYPEGKEYLAMWDTLDCKIMRYLGFGPEVSVANIVSLVAAGFFTGAIGIYFAFSVMFFGFFFIAATVRALHIFLSSSLSIIIFVFISPIIIPTLLFAKTKSIFDEWLKNLISFCIQPMILFAYIAIFITVMDRTLIGSAVFQGAPPAKAIFCKEVCKDSNGDPVPFVRDEQGQLKEPPCTNPGDHLVNPLDDSVACMMRVDKFGKFPGFELIGVTIPILADLFKENAKSKILTVLKGTLVMYLLYKFMDEIPGITSRLIGGNALPSSSPNAVGMLKKVSGIAAGIQKRATRVTGKALKKGGKAAKDLASKAGNKGKKAEDAKTGGDRSGSGDGGGDSSGGGGGSGDTTGTGNKGGDGSS